MHQSHLKAVGLLEQAVARDPRFVLAYCALGRLNFRLYFDGYDHTFARLELAQAAIQRAAQLQPEAGEVHLERGRYHQEVRDYDDARAELELARRALPNNPAVYHAIGYIDWRQGRWTEAVRNFERSIELDPRNVQFLVNTANTYSEMRRYPEAAELFRRAVAVSPHYYWARVNGAWQPFRERADIRPLHAELNAILAEEPDAAPKAAADLFQCAIFERDAGAADRALASIPSEGLAVGPSLVRPREWFVGYAAYLFNRPESARTAFEASRAILEKLLREQPENAAAWSLLGRVEAALGRKEEAIKAGRLGCELLPLSREPTSGLRPLLELAKIYAWVGEKDLAIQQLATSAGRVMGVSYGGLQLDPDWDSLRGDPRFQEIVASLAPKETVSK
jgi:tetratricopeptide (TPR) repeat protein